MHRWGSPSQSAQAAVARDWFLLTMKKVVYAANIAEADVGKPEEALPMVCKVREIADREGAEVLVISARVEEEIAEL